MFGSSPVFDRVAESMLVALRPTSALDIGAGAGRYGRLLRATVPECARAAIEVEALHTERHALREVYERVDVADAAQWWRGLPDEVFDLVILGDCLQQMPKSDGLDLLNAMVYRAAWLLVLVPEFVVQGAVDGLERSIHRSVWSERDMHWHDLWAWDNMRTATCIVLRGYQPSPVTIDALVTRINGNAVPLLDFDGQTEVRPCRLRLVDHGREVAFRPR